MIRETRLQSRTVVADGPLQLRVRLVYRLGAASRLTQHIVFHADSPRIDFETEVDWRETHAFLKAGFDVDVFADRARHEIQFGRAFRATHTNLSTDRARFESSNHRWSDLSEPGFGVAILNDCKYGISVSGSDMRLSLLIVENPAVVVESLKWAEDGDGFIVRLYEAEGNRSRTRLSFSVPVTVSDVNLLEEKNGGLLQGDEHGTVSLEFRPFRIRTLRSIPV